MSSCNPYALARYRKLERAKRTPTMVVMCTVYVCGRTWCSREFRALQGEDKYMKGMCESYCNEVRSHGYHDAVWQAHVIDTIRP